MKKVRIAVILLVGIFMVTIFPLFVTRVEASQGLPPGIIADKTDVCVGELVTFHNLTTVGTHPYTKAEWDFDADGIIDITLTGTEAEVLADVTHSYSTPGVYTVRLWMTDSTPTTRYEERPNYITVAECVTWTFPYGGIFTKRLPYWYTGQVVLADLDLATIPGEVQFVQWFDPDGLDWELWIPGIGGALNTLTAGNDYQVAVGGACEWDLPLTWPLETNTCTFYAAGFFPKHLPDTFTGQVVLADLDPSTIPDEVQGVWWYDGPALEWKFWVPGVGGDLMTLGGGHTYDYQVLVSGACEWEIPLP